MYTTRVSLVQHLRTSRDAQRGPKQRKMAFRRQQTDSGME